MPVRVSVGHNSFGVQTFLSAQINALAYQRAVAKLYRVAIPTLAPAKKGAFDNHTIANQFKSDRSQTRCTLCTQTGLMSHEPAAVQAHGHAVMSTIVEGVCAFVHPLPCAAWYESSCSLSTM